MAKRSKGILLTVSFALLGTAAALWPLLAESRAPREVVIVARQMAFHDEASAGDNPAIRVTPGERLRVTFVNEDMGVTHDLAVADWAVRIPALHSDERSSMVVNVPDRPGKFEYVCSMHPELMRGTIEVTGAAAPTR